MDRLRLALHAAGWLLLFTCLIGWIHGPVGASVFWPPTLLANVLHELCCTAVALGLLLLFWQKRFSLGVLLLAQPVALHFWIEGLAGAERAAAYRPLRVATMNVGHLQRGPREVLRHLAQERFDFVALQEIDRELQPLLETELAEQYPHRWFERRGGIAVGILSAHPFQRLQGPEFEAEPWWFEPQLVALDFEGEEIQILAHHVWVMASGFGGAEPSLRDVFSGAQHLRLAPRVLLLGDWNSTPTSAAASKLRRMGFTDAYQATAADLAGTYARRDPLGIPRPPWVRLDHAYVQGDLLPVSARIGPSLGADHLGVELVLDLGPAPRSL